MEKKWSLLLVAIGLIVFLFGVRGITGAATGDIAGFGLLSRTTVVSVIGIAAIAGLVVATQIIHRK